MSMMYASEVDIHEAAYACHKASALLRMAEDVAESFDDGELPQEIRGKGADLRETMTVVRELISREIYGPLLAMQEADARGQNPEKTRRFPG